MDVMPKAGEVLIGEPATDAVDLVRIEKSLQSLGFFASAASRDLSRTIVQVLRRPDGNRIQAKAIIEGIASLGLPTTADRDKYMAFMKIALDQRDFKGQLTNPVRFTGADMIRLLRLRKGGFHYDEINDWCKRMVATTIMSESSIFLADRRQYASDTFHVFDRAILAGEELADGTRSEHYQVFLSSWQLTNLNQGYVFPLDFKSYLRLNRNIAKALFGHLTLWFYASRGQVVEKKYADLCQILHVRAYPHLSKARSVLEPSMLELSEIGYVSEWELAPTTDRHDFKLMLSPGENLLSLPHFATATSGARAPVEGTLPPWVGELVARGVSERRGRQLALDIPQDQHVSDQIEYVDYLIAQDGKTRGKIANPAGLYIWAIQENLSVPEHFETSARRQTKYISNSVDGTGSSAYELQAQYEQLCLDRIRHHIAHDLGPELADLGIKQQLKALKREQADWYSRVPDAIRREVAAARFETQIRQTLNLPSFEHWLKESSQATLF